jgi:hypothetical protein
MAEYFTGDDWTINVTLKKNGVVFDASSATSVKAAVVSLVGNEPTEQIPETTQNEAASGADWTNGLIVVEFAAAATDNVKKYGSLQLEVQVEKDGKKETWPRKNITVNKGFIA